jgi:hypothetical protein
MAPVSPPNASDAEGDTIAIARHVLSGSGRTTRAIGDAEGDTIVVARHELAHLSTLLHQLSNDLTIAFGALALLEEQAAQHRPPAPELLPAALQCLDRVVMAVGQLQGGLRQLRRGD